MRFAKRSWVLAISGLIAAAMLCVRVPVRAADAIDSPTTIRMPSADVADTYLFPSPNTPGNVVVVMDVSPNLPAGSNSSAVFDQHVLYQMKFDNRISAEAQGAPPTEDLVIQFSVGAASGGQQQQILVYGPAAPNVTGANSSLIAQTGTGFLNQPFQTSNGMSVFAGVREDPFFFDYNQFYSMFPDRANSTAQSCLPASFGGNATCPQGFNNPGTDTQAGKNVLAIVVELPMAMLMPSGTGPKIAYWATTSTATGQ